jgi:hypothetical protein
MRFTDFEAVGHINIVIWPMAAEQSWTFIFRAMLLG